MEIQCTFENYKILLLDSVAIPCCVVYVLVKVVLVMATYTIVSYLIFRSSAHLGRLLNVTCPHHMLPYVVMKWQPL